jgi:Holliday junction resolvase RusA-like endonuclease
MALQVLVAPFPGEFMKAVMNRTLTVTIPGKPTARINPVKGRYTYFDPQKRFKDDLKFFFQVNHPRFKHLQGPLKLTVIFHLPIPKYWTQKKKDKLNKTLHTQKPDTSNLLKHLEDCCSKIFFKDDCQVAIINAKKIWSLDPRTELTIEEVTDEANLQY